MYKKVARLIPADKVVILLDRGIMDSKSYVSNEEFQEILAKNFLNEVEARDRYNAVFHLVTAADGAEEFYTLENNSARTETPKQARELDKRGIANWTGHPHFRMIDNSTNFEKKMERLLGEIYAVLGEPIPLEIERKYLIQKPNVEEIAKHTAINIVDIVQTYLKSTNDKEKRVRQRGQNGHFSYYLTEKKELDELRRVEKERKITEKEYIGYLANMDTSRPPLVKKRVCFVYQGQYFEVDLFDFSKDYALMEIELTDVKSAVELPKFINVIKEVTNNLKYRNYNLAQAQTL